MTPDDPQRVVELARALVTTWRERYFEHIADTEDGRAHEVRRCADDLDAVLVRAASVQPPRSAEECERIIATLHDTCADYEKMIQDLQAASKVKRKPLVHGCIRCPRCGQHCPICYQCPKASVSPRADLKPESTTKI